MLDLWSVHTRDRDLRPGVVGFDVGDGGAIGRPRGRGWRVSFVPLDKHAHASGYDVLAARQARLNSALEVQDLNIRSTGPRTSHNPAAGRTSGWANCVANAAMDSRQVIDPTTGSQPPRPRGGSGRCHAARTGPATI